MKALNEIQFKLFVFDLMIVALKRIENIIGEKAFEQKKKKPGLNLTTG